MVLNNASKFVLNLKQLTGSMEKVNLRLEQILNFR